MSQTADGGRRTAGDPGRGSALPLARARCVDKETAANVIAETRRIGRILSGWLAPRRAD